MAAPYMTNGQIDEFLQGSRHAVVSTLRRDGTAQLSPVWYLYEGGLVYIFVPVDSVKHRNLRRDPRISLCIDGGFPDFRAVMIYGKAEIVEDVDDGFERLRFQCMRRYYDNDEETQAYLTELNASRPSAMIVVRPQKVVGIDSSDD